MSDAPVKIVGLGPFRLPWERRRLRRAEQEARRLVERLQAVSQSGEPHE